MKKSLHCLLVFAVNFAPKHGSVADHHPENIPVATSVVSLDLSNLFLILSE